VPLRLHATCQRLSLTTHLMDDFETARQLLAQETRTLRLLNFRFTHLRLTNDQLLAGLQELLVQASLIAEATPAPDGDAPPPGLLKKDPPS
jgi:hypothetical protein